ncbi:hypothetical protein SAMN05444336_101837 [Albimonas donghaensis]|uniref:GIY-YIG nuclease family protein n=1 Tax=Albimonas donghaensis TaxID=356660 RepID=A0A1H2SZH1_9RHOB|nr:GIY-YIG nuclease family protein [Albimonas donghaensis]SDW36988.1 hypothetical protein SAMN05444336_101837 [Albimonas donghaensis]
MTAPCPPSAEARRAAVAAWKERKPLAGVYAVHCRPEGADQPSAWVASSPDLPALENRFAFTLRMNNAPHPSMNAAFRAHGADAFSMEILETLPADAEDIARPRLLKDMRDAWAEKLGAKRI